MTGADGPRRGVYPGSFNPPTVAHLEIADAARHQHHLDVVVLCVSRVALAKEHVTRPRLQDRLAVLRADAAAHEWLEVAVTDHQLLADIARGYDVIIMGADKWAQIHELDFYGGDVARRDRAIAALPEPAIAPRPPFEVPVAHLLVVPDGVWEVSSTRVRAGARAWMTPAARAFDDATGAWTDPDRYDAWLSSHDT